VRAACQRAGERARVCQAPANPVAAPACLVADDDDASRARLPAAAAAAPWAAAPAWPGLACYSAAGGRRRGPRRRGACLGFRASGSIGGSEATLMIMVRACTTLKQRAVCRISNGAYT
jgi:hypothetical protein